MSKRTDATVKPPVHLTVLVEPDLRAAAKSVLARKGKTFKEVVKKALEREVASK